MIADYQKAVIAALRADNALMALARKVTDRRPPEGTQDFPYVTVTSDAIAWDTDTTDGHEMRTRVHTWSRSGSNLEVIRIQEAVYAVLHNQTITVTGADIIVFQRTDSFLDDDPDGVTTHGVCEYRSLLDRS